MPLMYTCTFLIFFLVILQVPSYMLSFNEMKKAITSHQHYAF